VEIDDEEVFETDTDRGGIWNSMCRAAKPVG